jgi:hypothetical protein
MNSDSQEILRSLASIGLLEAIQVFLLIMIAFLILAKK